MTEKYPRYRFKVLESTFIKEYRQAIKARDEAKAVYDKAQMRLNNARCHLSDFRDFIRDIRDSKYDFYIPDNNV